MTILEHKTTINGNEHKTVAIISPTYKGNNLIITRDKWGKFYVHNDGITSQRKLNAEEIVRYLANALAGN